MPGRAKPLTRERVLQAALALVDREGLDALSMRRLAKQLGVEAMSLYNHVQNKADVVAGVLDLVAAEVDSPSAGLDWRTELRERALATYEMFVRRPWAARVWMSTARLNPDHFAHADALLRLLREAGLPPDAVYRAYHVLEGYTLGYAMQRLELPYDEPQIKELAGRIIDEFPAERYPDLAAHMRRHLEPHDAETGSFEFGLDLLLDGLERLSTAGGGRGGAPSGGGPPSS
jgi:AcrR family transcriptional regulator